MTENRESRRVAYFDVSYEMLAIVLNLPEGTKIERVLTPDDGSYWKRAMFRVVASHPDLPEVYEGEQLPRAKPSRVRNADGTVTFGDWGL